MLEWKNVAVPFFKNKHNYHHNKLRILHHPEEEHKPKEAAYVIMFFIFVTVWSD